MNDTIIVSRHAGAVEWLRRQGIVGEVIASADAETVRGRHVIGNLPMTLAAEAASVTIISMTVPPEARGRDLTPEEMDEFGAKLKKFKVLREEDWEGIKNSLYSLSEYERE